MSSSTTKSPSMRRRTKLCWSKLERKLILTEPLEEQRNISQQNEVTGRHKRVKNYLHTNKHLPEHDQNIWGQLVRPKLEGKYLRFLLTTHKRYRSVLDLCFSKQVTISSHCQNIRGQITSDTLLGSLFKMMWKILFSVSVLLCVILFVV